MIKEIVELYKKNNPEGDEQLIYHAYEFAKEAHQGQKRKSGEDYIQHPVAVAYILTELNMDRDTIIAALLHDVVEDTGFTYDQVKEIYGETVADLVEGVTKIGKLDFQTKEESQAENIRKMILAMAKDIRVVLIKLADRLHNMRTLKYMSPKKRIEKSRETLDIYAPIAHRLGISRIKWELEDIALRYIDEEGYYDLVKKVSIKRQEREVYIEDVIETIEERLKEINIQAEVTGRPKHFYSIYRKMVKQNKTFDQIYDLIAIRIIVNSEKDCYEVLGEVHSQWKPIPKRFKDYIAMPKANHYQSLHTSVMGNKGIPFEIQIRTWKMHRLVEYGIAAHWKYKEGNTKADPKNDMIWLQQIKEWQKELDNASEFVETVKMDILNESVYVFSPKGDVIELPNGSCPLDFAYRIHSDIGNSCIGAKIDGKMVTFNTKLETGNIVEILTSKHSNGPSRDWLKIVKSSHARNKIRQYFKKEEKEENIVKGKNAVEKEAKRLRLAENGILKHEHLEKASKLLKYNNIDDMYAAVGYGGIKISAVFQKIKQEYPELYPEKESLPEEILKKQSKAKKGKLGSTVKISGFDGMAIRFSQCCNPVPGDKIIGYITRGRGVSIHRTDCVNILNIDDPNRLIDAEWTDYNSGKYKTSIQIKAYQNNGLLLKMLKLLEDMKIYSSDFNAATKKDGFVYYTLTVEVQSTRELNQFIKNIKKQKDVIKITRL
jgi:GTP pyrophosphokinase